MKRPVSGVKGFCRRYGILEFPVIAHTSDNIVIGLVPLDVVGHEPGHALWALWYQVSGERSARDMAGQPLMKRESAPVFDFVDRIGVADRIVHYALLLSDAVDRKQRRAERTRKKVDAILFDQFERLAGRFAGVQLVVPHDQFGTAAIQATFVVELPDGKLSAFDLGLRIDAIGSCQGDYEPDLDGLCLREREGSQQSS